MWNNRNLKTHVFLTGGWSLDTNFYEIGMLEWLSHIRERLSGVEVVRVLVNIIRSKTYRWKLQEQWLKHNYFF